jgi:GT2 family glycosyltransferase
MRDVSIVILNWDGRQFLAKCIPSVIQAVRNYPGECEIIVVDNGSKDGSISYLESTFPQIKIISLPENMGFSKGVNRGIRESKNRFVISLNNDVVVREDFIEPLVEHFREKDVFSVGAKMLRWDRTTLDFGHAAGRFIFGFLKIKFRDTDRPQDTLYACAGAAAYDKLKFLELGGFDEELGLWYWEDCELCWRAWGRNWRTIFEPRSIVYHKHLGTSSRKYGMEEILTASRQSHFLFMWKDIRDKWFLCQHIIFLPAIVIVALSIGRFYFIKGLFRALGQLKLVKEKRQVCRKDFVTDREVLRRCVLD